MADAFTCKVSQFGKGKRVIKLFGDKTVQVEAAQHVIEFPGGAIELSRTTDGDYWMHLIVHKKEIVDDCEGCCSARGEIVGHRIDYEYGQGPDGPQPGAQAVFPIPNGEQITQIAVLVRPRR